jgi:hypothetical protein
MLIADMIYLASHTEGYVCLVGSDDDMWPGIISVLAAGGKVIHLETKAGAGSSPYLLQNHGTYVSKELR